jgi:hypothetical protein
MPRFACSAASTRTRTSTSRPRSRSSAGCWGRGRSRRRWMGIGSCGGGCAAGAKWSRSVPREPDRGGANLARPLMAQGVECARGDATRSARRVPCWPGGSRHHEGGHRSRRGDPAPAGGPALCDDGPHAARQPDPRCHRHRTESLPRRFVARLRSSLLRLRCSDAVTHRPRRWRQPASRSARWPRRWDYLDDELVALDAQLDGLTAGTAPVVCAHQRCPSDVRNPRRSARDLKAHTILTRCSRSGGRDWGPACCRPAE